MSYMYITIICRKQVHYYYVFLLCKILNKYNTGSISKYRALKGEE